MADDLPTTIMQAAGQAATVRVGIVTSVSPLAISLNGTPLNMEAVGVIGGGFVAGGPVVLLGQSVQGASTSGSTWCALGTPSQGDQSPRIPYVPRWFSDGVQPTLGDGLISGSWLPGGVIDVRFKFTRGAGSANGTGTYFFTIPPADPSMSGTPVGTWYLLDAGVQHYSGTLVIGNPATFVFCARDVGAVSAGSPIALTTGDSISGHATYPAI